ncbi:hypothetical protein [Streptobacillus moniliformis]|uniref:Outer membrane protein beta-barrel domain-containing protein n=1 Tax=Streptobacillus moniliformis (strain ATCC 14647 / DSM 12112 / NCTC 10651 / 9901) TaxID=519441 RepID=D1AWW8_STRM9|nr:hypothetical protein [Streptobacillus moniliformis]ACZ00794.1 hypothetical protein Smon_0310 [Streptobacillus moniliformis DSM 12112]AVL42809.1 hypothetical protein CEP89_02645 [Streptobacillus moniliformis]SQA14071.1 Uncharacterised protein [Streptobacillus moniliformis]
MRKLLLSIILFIGLISFPAKINKLKSKNIKKSNVSIELKIAEPMHSVNDFDKFKITGPRYRIEANLGYYRLGSNSLRGVYRQENKKHDGYFGISFLVEYKAKIGEFFDITFGPKIIFQNDFEPIYYSNSQIILYMLNSLNLGAEIGFDYRLKENLTIYNSIEAFIGLKKLNVIDFKSNTNYSKYFKIQENLGIKIAYGVKIKDKYNVALYTSWGKGAIGIEAGYTF